MSNSAPKLRDLPVTPDAVRWAYRLLLGREPENEAIIEDFAAHIANLAELRERFLASSEFQEGRNDQAKAKQAGLEPPRRVDVDVDDAARQHLIEHVAASWSRLGETEPYWSVLSEPGYLMERVGETRETFLASGREHVELLFATLRRNGIEPDPQWDVFELGCGLGRITRWLAQSFRKVTACDISAPHLQLAQSINRDAPDFDRIYWQLLTGPDDLPRIARCDLFFSVMVLQHNPPPVIAMLLEGIAEALRPGGVAFFQVPTYHRDYHFELDKYLQLRGGTQEIEMHVLPQARVIALFEKHGCVPIEIFEDGLLGGQATQRSNIFLFRKLAAGEAAGTDPAQLRASNAGLLAELADVRRTAQVSLDEARAVAEKSRETALQAAQHARSLESEHARERERAEEATRHAAALEREHARERERAEEATRHAAALEREHARERERAEEATRHAAGLERKCISERARADEATRYAESLAIDRARIERELANAHAQLLSLRRRFRLLKFMMPKNDIAQGERTFE